MEHWINEYTKKEEPQGKPTPEQLQEARLKAHMNKKIRDTDGTIKTYREYYKDFKPIRKRIAKRTHATRKTNLEYKKLKNPKTERFLENDRGQLARVPKLVYGFYCLPEKTIGRF